MDTTSEDSPLFDFSKTPLYAMTVDGAGNPAVRPATAEEIAYFERYDKVWHALFLNYRPERHFYYGPGTYSDLGSFELTYQLMHLEDGDDAAWDEMMGTLEDDPDIPVEFVAELAVPTSEARKLVLAAVENLREAKFESEEEREREWEAEDEDEDAE